MWNFPLDSAGIRLLEVGSSIGAYRRLWAVDGQSGNNAPLGLETGVLGDVPLWASCRVATGAMRSIFPPGFPGLVMSDMDTLDLSRFAGFPENDWKSATHADLRAAVADLRHEFARDEFFDNRSLIREAREALVHAVHPQSSFDASLKQWQAAVSRLGTTYFHDFLQIARANPDRVGTDPVSWAYGHVYALQAHHFGLGAKAEGLPITACVKEVCDENRPFDFENPNESFERWLFRKDWRAPKWLEA